MWRIALARGEIEKRLGVGACDAHLAEAAQLVLSIAGDLDDAQREIYLAAFDRRRALVHARGLD